jgi:hypothetical protein
MNRCARSNDQRQTLKSREDLALSRAFFTRSRCSVAPASDSYARVRRMPVKSEITANQPRFSRAPRTRNGGSCNRCDRANRRSRAGACQRQWLPSSSHVSITTLAVKHRG